MSVNHTAKNFGYQFAAAVIIDEETVKFNQTLVSFITNFKSYLTL